MAKLYEKAWNKVVDESSDWRKKVIINNFPYDDPADKRVADDVTKEAIQLAEQWERESKGKITTPAP
jgi:hypothetical protein|tara:strand:+ start:1762 stop:1962 length:201 start_codon:yes stop_codon:yes gene_type:complete